MKTRRIASVLFVLFIVSFARLLSQDDVSAYMDMLKPNDNHKVLYQLEGSWKQNIMYSSTSEPMYSSGETKNEIIYGGRYLLMTGNMSIVGMPVKTTVILGYDNSKSKYFVFGIDEMGTDPVYANGDYDKSKKQITFTGSSFDPIKKKKNNFRIVITFDRENKYTYQIYNSDGKKEIKKLEIVSIKKSE